MYNKFNKIKITKKDTKNAGIWCITSSIKFHPTNLIGLHSNQFSNVNNEE